VIIAKLYASRNCIPETGKNNDYLKGTIWLRMHKIDFKNPIPSRPAATADLYATSRYSKGEGLQFHYLLINEERVIFPS